MTMLGLGYPLQYSWATLVAQTVKNRPALWEAWVGSLGWEDPLEEGIPTAVSLPGESHGQRSLAGCSPWGRNESDTTERLSTAQGLCCHAQALSSCREQALLSSRRVRASPVVEHWL